MNTAGAVVLALVLLLLAAGVGWVIFTRVRAARLGVCTHLPSLPFHASPSKALTNHHPPPQLPPPPLKSYIPFLSSSSSPSYGASPRPGGLIGWFNDRFSRSRNTRTAAGAYEGSSSAGYNNGGYSGDRGQHHHLDPDDAWDSRVVGGYNPYEEERELGTVSHAQSGGAPHGEGYRMNLAGEEEHEEEERGRPRSRSPVTGAGATALKPASNPFGDDAESSNISLRGVSPRPMDGTSFAGRKAAKGEDDRRSLFREDV